MLRLRIGAVLALLLAVPLVAQENKIPSGVKLGFIYQTGYRPRVAVRPVEAQGMAQDVGSRIYDILQRDLDYSDHFEMAATPAGLATGAVDYKAWNDLGVVYLVTAQVQPSPRGYALRLALHDVVYGKVKEIQSFALPAADDADFRMSVHAAADEVVRWATGQPGDAASRIVFRRKGGSGGADELMIVDSDGENLRRLATGKAMLFSPNWGPEGRRILYSEFDGARSRILELSLDDGKSSVVTQSAGLLMTPVYAPDGSHIAYARYDAGGARVYSFDAARDCCVKRLTNGGRDDLSPSYSPDGSRLLFNSSRLGQPHIYVMPAAGGEPTLLSPFVYGEPGYYTSPDWSPIGTLVTFHGRSRGNLQIMVADASKPGATVQQITDDGVSEDPSWAPDGRHIVFSGQRDGRWGLYVIDSVTGRLRPLAVGGRFELPDWSPELMTASHLTFGG